MVATGHGIMQRCGKSRNVVKCAEMVNKLPIEESLLQRGSVRRFCGSGNDEQNKQKAGTGAAVLGLTPPPLSLPAYMHKMGLWLIDP